MRVQIRNLVPFTSITQYCFKPASGIKLSKITGLNNNLSLALAQHPIRIEAPIPGKSLIGIEVPNRVSTMVRLRDFMESAEFAERKTNLTLALGQDVGGNYIFGDLTEMPHLMIAGATGTGKSVSINTIITTLLYQNSPDDLKMILIDPKRVELTAFNGIPHLLTPTVVDNGKVANSLKWAIGEMERRYKMLQEASSRDIFSYNEKIKPGQKKYIIDEETREALGEEEVKRLPYIVIIIDELADIMASHSKDVEAAIVRLAQMARAVGIHLIVSTQRPSVEVLTGLIKANITTRIAFQVATQIDSRTILDMGGAEKLLGNGDMLYLSSRSPKPKRIQGVFVSESEVKRVVKSIKSQLEGEVEYDEDVTAPQRVSFEGKMNGAIGGGDEDGDDLYEKAICGMIDEGAKIKALPYEGYWQAIKYPWHVQEVFRHLFGEGEAKISDSAHVSDKAVIEGSVVIDDDVRVLDGAFIKGPCYIGKGTIVATNSLVREANIGAGCVIGFSTEVARSYLGDNVWTHSNYIGDSVIGNDVSFGAGAVVGNLRLDEGIVLVDGISTGTNKFGIITGDHIRVGVNSCFMPGIKIGSESFIGAGIVVAQDIPEKSYVRGDWKLKISENKGSFSEEMREMMRKKL